MEELKAKARDLGLWNLFHPDERWGAGLSNVDYAPLAEIMGRSPIGPEACNCNAPDTGNMEVLTEFGTPEQQERWLRPLLDGEIRSGFAMTEPDVASSDATNIRLRIERDGDEYVLNGRKWWTTGALHPHNRILIVMGKTAPDAPRHRQQSMVLVPRDTPRRHRRARPARVRLPGPGRARRDPLRGRPRPGLQPHRRRGRRLPHQPGPPRPRPHPPLHADDRRGRARAGAALRARAASGSRSASPSRRGPTSATGSPRRASSWR